LWVSPAVRVTAGHGGLIFEELMKRNSIVIVLLVGLVHFSFATDYYVSTSGSDASGNGSQSKPWRTLRHALSKVPANQGHTIKLSSGTFVENGPLKVPTRVNIEGAGTATIIKAASSFHHSGGWNAGKLLFQLVSNSSTDGDQYLKNFVIDGDDRKLYGGIRVEGRNRILIQGLTVRNTNFVGIWLIKVKDSRVTNVTMRDCSMASATYGTGSICVASIERVELDHLDIEDNYGCGIKAMGVSYGPIYNCKFHDNKIKSAEKGYWVNNGNLTPSISFELFDAELVGNEVYNNVFQGCVSIVNNKYHPPKNRIAIRIHHNTFDNRPGNNYGLELTVHDAEVDHNYFYGGKWGITDWRHSSDKKPFENWKIHHNVFYNIKGSMPGLVRSEQVGLVNVEIYNNTIEFVDRCEFAILQLVGGSSRNIKIKNNLIINNTKGPYPYGPPVLIQVRPGASLSGLQVTNNFLQNLPIGNYPGSYSNNLSGDPQITMTGSRPEPYYFPKSGSPLIDRGVDVGFPYSGSAPDIGAFEYGSTTNPPANKKPQGSLSSPSDNSVFSEGTAINLQANAADPDGTVTKVEFFAGSQKLGEDTNSPYTFDWKDAEVGTHEITVKVTDDDNASATSAAVTISVVGASNKDPQVHITSPATNSEFAAGAPITLRADASDSDGTVEKVEFYVGSKKIGDDTSSPFTFEWVDAPVGDNQVTAKATDNKGATATSPAVRIVVLADGNEAPVVALSSPANNSTHTEGTPITLRATASDKDGTIKKVEFFLGANKLGEDTTEPYSLAWDKARVGTYTITARATDDKDAVGVSAPLSVHVKAPSNNAPVVQLTSPKNNATVNAGNITLSATATDADGAVTKVEFFNGSTKLGEDLSSPYNYTWNGVKPGTYTLTARATDNKSATTTSAVVTIKVVQPNKAPTIAITSPSNNATFTQGAWVKIEVAANDSDGAISKVEFFSGNKKLGEDLSSPYVWTWTNVPAGNHTITAKATDNKSATATSQPVAISVSAPNKLPLVQLTSPEQNAKFNQGATITIAASASDSDGSITKVEFYSGSKRLGQDTSSPYSYAWTNVPAGTYTITAKATDNRSGVTTSNAVTITVAVPNKAPVVKITKPANNTVFTEGQSISLEATATDSDGQITKVEFFNGNVRLGQDTSSPYTLDWPNALPGKYTLTAKATDNKGATATATVNIEVKEQEFEPIARAGNDVSVELPENSVTLNGEGESNNGDIIDYEWVQLDGPPGAEMQVGPDGEVVITNLAEGTYRFQLTVTDVKNKKASDIITVRVYPLPLTAVELPRVFSPNGDGINDYWEWSNTELFRGSRLVIFNRQGQIIYEATSYDNTWDGTVDGKPLQEDAYYYVITSNQGEVNGAVRIVR
jgi:gliding motility-associated-like protein